MMQAKGSAQNLATDRWPTVHNRPSAHGSVGELNVLLQVPGAGLGSAVQGAGGLPGWAGSRRWTGFHGCRNLSETKGVRRQPLVGSSNLGFLLHFYCDSA